MCAMCDGQSADEFLAGVIDDIDRVGWAVVAVEDERGCHRYSYTVGLTRHHGHAELIVAGGDFETSYHVLDTLAAAVQAGRRFRPGQTVTAGEIGRECVLLPVTGPSPLVLAQTVYGTVTALQVCLRSVLVDGERPDRRDAQHDHDD